MSLGYPPFASHCAGFRVSGSIAGLNVPEQVTCKLQRSPKFENQKIIVVAHGVLSKPTRVQYNTRCNSTDLIWASWLALLWQPASGVRTVPNRLDLASAENHVALHKHAQSRDCPSLEPVYGADTLRIKCESWGNLTQLALSSLSKTSCASQNQTANACKRGTIWCHLPDWDDRAAHAARRRYRLQGLRGCAISAILADLAAATTCCRTLAPIATWWRERQPTAWERSPCISFLPPRILPVSTLLCLATPCYYDVFIWAPHRGKNPPGLHPESCLYHGFVNGYMDYM